MPEEPRRLLKMQVRSAKAAKSLLYTIPILFGVLALAYVCVGILVPYDKNWVINAIIGGVVFVAGSLLLLVIRSISLKKSRALSSSIMDFVEQYNEICQAIRDLKRK